MAEARYRKALLNSLRMERLEQLSIKEKGAIVNKLKKDTGKSYRELEKMTGIPHSTLLDWATGRQKNVPGTLHVSIEQLIKHFGAYQPRLKEFEQIKQLISTLNKLLEKHNAH